MSEGKESLPPAAHLKKLLPESGIVYTGLDECPQCGGGGYDSSARQSTCCSCSGLGEVFQCVGQPFDYREQREAVEALKALEAEYHSSSG